MARNQKLQGIQIFDGGLAKPDVYLQHAGIGCCNTVGFDYDKLPNRLRFNNGLNHTNPMGGNLKKELPFQTWSSDTDGVLNAINAGGVGTHISVIGIPTFAFVTGVAVKIWAEEPGLTFDLVTRNGLVLPTAKVMVVTTAGDEDSCTLTHTMVATGGGASTVTGTANLDTGAVTGTATADVGDATAFTGFGELGDARVIDIIGYDGSGQFSLEADEIAVRVATMPSNGIVTGQFRIQVAVNFEVVVRAEY